MDATYHGHPKHQLTSTGILILVPAVGLEPTLPEEFLFERNASACSARPG